MATGICKLCLKNSKLSKSHVIPDFFYNFLYDEKHFLHTINPNNILQGKKYNKKISTGEYDKNIICNNCENLLSKFETYGKIFFYGGYLKKSQHIEYINYKTKNGFKFTKAKNINYSLLKLFFLSISWRVSVSSREFFKETKLGIFEESIRKMLISEKPCQENSFPVLCFTYLNNKSIPPELIMQPSTINFKGLKVFRFFLNGFILAFILNNDVIDKFVLEHTLLENGTISILFVNDKFNKNTLFSYFGI